VPHPHDESQVLRVSPPLDPSEVELLAGLAGADRVVRRVWPGQPGPRSPWVPCDRGCCLAVEPRVGVDPVVWVRFLLKELLAPQARVARERAERVGLPGGHRLDGRIVLDRTRLLAVAGRQVRLTRAEGGDGAGGSRHN
jgi:hypothetical protein